MIERYTRPEMASVWSERRKYQIWLKVELAVCEELASSGKIPKSEWLTLRKKTESLLKSGGVDPKRVEHFEAITRHDVIAFTTAVAEIVGPTSRYIHYGLTSSDVVDTSLSIMMSEAGAILVNGLEKLQATLKKRALEFEKLSTIGRSHGIWAEPTSFGLKFLGWHQETGRNLERLRGSLSRMKTGKLSGAVGVNAHWGPEFEEKVLKKLGLAREKVSTQVIPRDHHAEFVGVLALCGSSLERIAVELRHLQRSEVSEVYEGFQKGQKGSSAMPHKKNPISSENISGCARLLRSYAQAALENVALWHERDISHSAVERIVMPDATLLLDYALDRMERVLSGLVVRQDRVSAHLKSAGAVVYSGHFLLALVEAGASREDAYSWIQACALPSVEGKGDFTDLMSNHDQVRKLLGEKKIRELGSNRYQLRNVREIYQKALGTKK